MENYRQRLLQIWGEDPSDLRTALGWIEACVQNEVPEDLYLDFKRKTNEQTPAPDDADKGNFARAISGFANTDGGLVVWGVDARPGSKDEPDVARNLRPIRGLKTFTTRLNALCGGAVSPPLGGIENRQVPSDQASDTGYVITLVPPRHETLTQAAMGKYNGQFFIRTGSGFYVIPQSLLAVFYSRRPSPLLSLRLQLAEPPETKIVEELENAERWKATNLLRTGVPPRKKPWGCCTFRQSLAVDWDAFLRNDGLASSSQVALQLRVRGSAKWSLITAAEEKHWVQPSFGYQITTSAPPWPRTIFTQVTSDQGATRLVEPVHPGQEIRVATGTLHVPATAFENQPDDLEFEIRGIAYGQDSPPFELRCRVEGSELTARYSPIFRENAPPAIRELPEPTGPFDE